MQLPAFKLLSDESKTTVYEGEAVYRQRVTGNGSGTAQVTIMYQCCDNSICFPPRTVKLDVEL